ncbi:hypothetical protein B9G69_000690 [Bdellovibrio sp. SKB1291214]|uniref:hypothetical protein n=1 Tax=Bdellovibrio sp. SKB1291214 TaxID=1732569 RepID=UPI000B514C53|nr:hypothetical protein [Bdellovibrio sp. SKB1291214]UYL09092.1 hypothetical protein B9G69_000690 [Bdellovibrio sp. SKB1291214]
MSHPGDSASFVPRENLKRTLTYRRHIKWFYWACLALALVAGSLLAFNWVAALLALAIIAPASRILRTKAHSSVTVFSDRVEIESLGQKTVFPFEDIKEIKFNYAPYLSGLFQIISDKGRYKFPISLERSEYVLEAIIAYNPKLASKEEIEKYRKTAVLTDHGWAYFHDKFPSITKILLKFIVTPVIAAVPLAIISGYHESDFDYVKLIVMSVFFGVIQVLMSGLAMKLESIILISKAAPELTKNPNNLKRNTEFENKVYRRSELLQKILLAILVLIYCFRLL